MAVAAGCGHIGDGNLHLNVGMIGYDTEKAKSLGEKLEPWAFEKLRDLQGSISAEHGVGYDKAGYLSYSRDSNSINLMKGIKDLIDKNGIMNPYKVLM